MSNVTITTLRDAFMSQIKTQLALSSDQDTKDFADAVDWFPGDPTIYVPKSPKGGILVFWSGTQFTKDLASNVSFVPQTAVYQFDITVLSLSLFNQDIATKILDAIKDALKNFTPTGADAPCWIEREGFVGVKQGVWQYGQRWNVKGLRRT